MEHLINKGCLLVAFVTLHALCHRHVKVLVLWCLVLLDEYE
jgi:hypothetical protein